MWVQSRSDYDFLAAQAFPHTCCSLHWPVILWPDPLTHSVYSAIDPLESDGHPVLCRKGCGHDNLTPEVLSTKVKIRCLMCHSTCEAKLMKVDAYISLQRKDIHKASFPTTQAGTNLRSPSIGRQDRLQKNIPSQGREGRMGAPTNTSQIEAALQPPLPVTTISSLHIGPAVLPPPPPHHTVPHCQTKQWRLADGSPTPP